MIVCDVATKVLDTEIFPQSNIAGLISGITFIILFGQEKPLRWKEINTYTHKHTHKHPNPHTHTHKHIHTNTYTHTHTHTYILNLANHWHNVSMPGFIFLDLGSLAAWNELLNNIRLKSICVWAYISSCYIFKTYVASLFSFWKGLRFLWI